MDAYHGEKDEGFSAGGRGLVVADEASVAHEPAEGAFDDPAASQDSEAAGLVGAFDDRDGELGSEATDPGGESRAGVAAVDAQLSSGSPAGRRAHPSGPLPSRACARADR